MTAGGPRPGSGRPRTPEAERSVTVTLRLPPDLAREIDAAAARTQTTRTAVIVRRLEDWIAKQKASGILDGQRP